MVKRVRTAVFPVAGLGTRFLPATKAMPKEMLTVVDRPLIQYAVSEAKEAGISGHSTTIVAQVLRCMNGLTASTILSGRSPSRSIRRRLKRMFRFFSLR